MKKIFYLIAAVGLTWTVVSCDNEPKNPGDYSIASEMSLSDIVSQVDGKVYALQVARSVDSVFGTNVTVWDTIWDDNGEFLERSSRVVWVPAKFTTKYVEYEPVFLPIPADTFAINIYSNAKWTSPQPTRPRGGVQFYNLTTGGGGDGTLLFRSDYNEFYNTTAPAALNIYSSDSTVYHKVLLHQYGEIGD